MNKRKKPSAGFLFAQFAAQQGYGSLPQAVIERVKTIFLDTLGIMVRGTSAPSLAKLRRALVTGDCGNATVLGSPYKAHPSTAALLNGSLPTLTQYDEGYRPAMGHPGIHIVPAAFAIGEERKVSGKDLITAIATGYEVAVRIGLSVFPLNPLIHPHGNWGAIGAAVSVGKVLSFSEREFVDLIDSASNLALFTWRKATISGGTVHHLSPGLGASHAILAAFGVQAGLVGPPACLEEFFLPLSSSGPKSVIMADDLGTTYEILNNYFKAYPACAHAHSSIEAFEKILASHSFSVQEVDSIEVRTYPLAARLTDQNPLNTLAGMFSIPYCLGTMLVKGRLMVETLATETPPDLQILKAASRVQVTKDEYLEPRFPQGRPSLVRVRLKNGKEYEKYIPLPRERVSKKELGKKFINMVGPFVGKKRGEELRGKIDALEKVPDIRQLNKYLSFDSKA